MTSPARDHLHQLALRQQGQLKVHWPCDAVHSARGHLDNAFIATRPLIQSQGLALARTKLPHSRSHKVIAGLTRATSADHILQQRLASPTTQSHPSFPPRSPSPLAHDQLNNRHTLIRGRTCPSSGPPIPHTPTSRRQRLENAIPPPRANTGRRRSHSPREPSGGRRRDEMSGRMMERTTSG